MLVFRFAIVFMNLSFLRQLRGLLTTRKITKCRLNVRTIQSLYSTSTNIEESNKVSFPQSLDFTSIKYAVDELQSYTPSKIENIIQDDPYNLFIAIKTAEAINTWIHFSWNPQSAWFTLSSQPPLKSKPFQLSFEATLQSFLSGMTISKISLFDYENRIIYLDISEKSSVSPKYRLYFEMLGVHSNIILVDIFSNNILTCGYQNSMDKTKINKNNKMNHVNGDSSGIVDKSRGSKRNIQIGQPYNPPLTSIHTTTASSISSSLIKYEEFCMSLQHKLANSNKPILVTLYNYLLQLSPTMSPNVIYSILYSTQLLSPSTCTSDILEKDSYSGNTSSSNNVNSNNSSNSIRVQLDDSSHLTELTSNQIHHIYACYSIWYKSIMIPKSDKSHTSNTYETTDITEPNAISSSSSSSSSSSALHVNMIYDPIIYDVIDRKGVRRSIYSLIQFTPLTITSSDTTTDTTTLSDLSSQPTTTTTTTSTTTTTTISPVSEDTISTTHISPSSSLSLLSTSSSKASKVTTSVLSYLQQYYHNTFRNYLFITLKQECSKKILQKLDKVNRFIQGFQNQLLDASNGKAESLRDQADLITSFLYNTTIIKHTQAYHRYNQGLMNEDDDIALLSESTPASSGSSTLFKAPSSSSSSSPSPSSSSSNKDDYAPIYIVHCINYDTGEPMDITIDNGMNPTDYTKYLYKQSKRVKRSIEKLETLLSQAQSFYDYLLEIETSITNLRSYTSYYDIITLREILDELNDINKIAFDISLTTTTTTSSSSSGDLSIDTTSTSTSNNKNMKEVINKKLKGTNKKQQSQSQQKKNDKMTATNNNNNNNNNNNVISKKKLMGLLLLQPPFSSDRGVGFEKGGGVGGGGGNKHISISLLIGRNSKQNERITFEIAKDHHLWFHVQGSPGSHCLLLLEPGQSYTTLNPDILQFAADVASYFSQARGSTKVPVDYCSPKHLKRPQGIRKLGLVMMTKQYGTILGRPDQGEKWVNQYAPKDVLLMTDKVDK